MIKDYILNAGMMIAFASLINQIFNNVSLSPKSAFGIRLGAGFIYGLLAFVLMVYGILLPNQTLVDFRFLAIIMAALNAGWQASALACLMAILARIIIYGISDASLVAIPTTILVTIVACVLAYTKTAEWKKWAGSVSLSLIFVCSAYFYLIHEEALRLRILLSYSISFILLSVFMYYYMIYLNRINESFRNCRIESARDFLTGLNNVRSFDSLYNRALEQTLVKQQYLSLIYLDIDHFKNVNDTYGHKEGDIVLSKLGEVLVNSTRTIDFVSRNGGEEFSVILIDCRSILALEIAERIRKNVEETPITLSDGKVIQITVSLGIATFPEPLGDYKLLREKADGALYEAKRSGRNKAILAK